MGSSVFCSKYMQAITDKAVILMYKKTVQGVFFSISINFLPNKNRITGQPGCQGLSIGKEQTPVAKRLDTYTCEK